MHFNDKKPNEDVVFVAIDEKSVTQFGRWPWDREFLGYINYSKN